MRKPFNGNFPVTQGFGANPQIYGPGGHRGIDYGLPNGTPVIAVANGVVNKPAQQPNGFGTYLTLSFGEYICYYGHLSQVTKTGNAKEGEVIGYSDNTGWSSGPHLHFEVYKNRTLINPSVLLTQASSGGTDMYDGKSAEEWYRIANDWHVRADDRQKVIERLEDEVQALKAQVQQTAVVLNPGIYRVK